MSRLIKVDCFLCLSGPCAADVAIELPKADLAMTGVLLPKAADGLWFCRSSKTRLSVEAAPFGERIVALMNDGWSFKTVV